MANKKKEVFRPGLCFATPKWIKGSSVHMLRCKCKTAESKFQKPAPKGSIV